MFEYLNLERTKSLETLGYGSYVFEDSSNSKTFVIGSAPTFELFIQQLNLEELPQNSVVISPELITSSGPLNISLKRDAVSEKIKQIQLLAESRPDCTFLLSTGYWEEENTLPLNAILVISDGFIRQKVAKRFGTPGEDKYFSFNHLERFNNLYFDQGVGLLTCRDLYMESLRERERKYQLKLSGLEDMDADDLLPNEVHTVIVSSCWGTGSRIKRAQMERFRSVQRGESTVESMANAMFLLSLQVCISGLFENKPNINKVIVCDRAPLQEGESSEEETIMSTVPFTGIYFRK